MRSFEIFVAPQSIPVGPPLRDDVAPPPSRRSPKLPAREVLDIFIEGANVTARVNDTHASCVLRDLAAALLDMSKRESGKSIVRFYDEPWELCVERLGAKASLSVYRGGPEPVVAVYDRQAQFRDVVDSAMEAIESVLARSSAPQAVLLELHALRDQLANSGDSIAPGPELVALPPSTVTIDPDRDALIGIGAEFALRAGASRSNETNTVERTDLHALLFRGRLRAEIRGRAVELGECHPFLVAERLLDAAKKTLNAWERGLHHNARTESGGIVIGVRLAADGKLALTLASADPVQGGARSVYTFPALSVLDFLDATLSFGRALVRAILRRDRSQGANLRLSAFRRQLRETTETLLEASRQDSKINPTPEPYRAFAEGSRRPTPAARSTADSLRSTRLRYTVRWRALVPGIDLRSTFLCGDRLIVGALQETFCLDRSTGEVIWRIETSRASSVITPGGVARISPDGIVRVHDFGNGEATLETRITPRVGGPISGAVVHSPGLPRLLIVTEGEQHLVAIDLTSGEPRFRLTWGKKNRGNRVAAPRMRRVGKLIVYASGDSALTAVDALTGSVVWRVRDRLRFRAQPVLDHDLLFAIAGGANCAAQLHAIDPYSGVTRWAMLLPSPPTACTVDGLPLVVGHTVAIAIRERNSLRLVGIDRENGAVRWTSNTVAPVGTSWLAVDGLFIGNTPTGEVVAIEAASGTVRYRHPLGAVLETDVPRRLEPVLRSGALFVPHTNVHVLRPHDGELLATLGPCEAIPDLLRVDEKCDVYVAEESGHLVSFSAAAKLSLVRN